MKNQKVKEYIEISLGVLIFSMGFYFFLQPLSLVTGGIMGISVLITPHIAFLSNAVFILVINVITLVLGLLVFGKQFFLRTVYAAILSPLLLLVLELLSVKDDFFIAQVDSNYQLLVSAITAGALVGIGIGLVLRNNATTGGMDVFQRMTQKYLRIPYSWAVYLTDGLIIIAGMTISFQNGVFGLVSLVICAYAIDKVAVIGHKSYTVLIITKEVSLIRDAIFTRLDRGCTLIEVKGGYTNEAREMILSTMYRSQIYELKQLVNQIDKDAFTLVLNTKEVVGEGFIKDHMS